MKRERSLIYTAALLLAGVTNANATPAVWTDEFDPAGVLLSSSASNAAGRSLSFSLDLRQGADGFRPGSDFIDSALLTIVLFDDFDFAPERVGFNFDGGTWTSSAGVIGGGLFPDLFVFSPLEFLGDGLLNVSVRATRGDFIFDSAFLAAFGERTPVPEPATIALFGVGLFGMGWTLRRQSGAVRRRLSSLALRNAKLP